MNFQTKKEDFILITSKTNVYIENANRQFKNKYVFYSPSITTGVSFVYAEMPQTQFIYISGQSVNPIGIYQMASRTRNMKELIYHCEDITPQKMKYQNQEELEIKYKKMIETNDKILRLSQSINKYDEAEIVENTYFKLFCYNDFLADIFKTDFLQHFKIILVNNGFSMSEVGEVKNLNYSIKRKQKALMNTIKNNEIDEFIGIVHEEITDKLSKDMEDFIKDTFLEIIRPGLNYELLLKRHEIIGLQTKDDIIKYKDFLQDEHTLTNLFNFQKLFRTDDYINKKIEENNKNCQKVKNLSNIYTKINLLRVFEKVYNIERLDLNFTNISLDNKITEDKIELIYNVYRFTKSDLSTVENVIKLYINMITNICGDLKVVLSGQKRIKKF